VTLVWTPQGPRPNTRGQLEGLGDGEVVGAIKAVAAHPTNPDIVYVGAVNGGVWRSGNARNTRPTWEQLTDAQRSLSIGALEFDPTDSTHQTLVAGTGRFSSLRRIGGALIGVLRTTDGGVTWATLDGGGQISGVHVYDVAPRGQTIVIATNPAGVFRTTDAGGTWAQVPAWPERVCREASPSRSPATRQVPLACSRTSVPLASSEPATPGPRGPR
jgi:hypothetical protein